MTPSIDLRHQIEQRRLMIAIGGGFDVNSRRFNAAFCRCLVLDVEDQPDDVVPFERTVRRIRAMIGRGLNYGPDIG